MTQKNNENLNYTIATLAIEHLAPSDEVLRLCIQVSDGAMDADTAVMTVLRQYWQSVSPEGGLFH